MPRWTKLIAVLAALAALWLIGGWAGSAVPAFAAWVEQRGALAPVLFVAGYVVATVALVPASLLTLAAGALFGVQRGVLYVMVGATLGATAAFLVSRYLARPLVERKLRGAERFARMDQAVGRNGLRVVLLLRLSPVFPFVVLNYALGLTRVRLAHYVLACVGMLPGTLLYVYYGRVIGDVAALAADRAPPRGPGAYALLALGLAATLAVTVLVTRIARRALREEKLDEEPAP